MVVKNNAILIHFGHPERVVYLGKQFLIKISHLLSNKADINR